MHSGCDHNQHNMTMDDMLTTVAELFVMAHCDVVVRNEGSTMHTAAIAMRHRGDLIRGASKELTLVALGKHMNASTFYASDPHSRLAKKIERESSQWIPLAGLHKRARNKWFLTEPPNGLESGTGTSVVVERRSAKERAKGTSGL